MYIPWYYTGSRQDIALVGGLQVRKGNALTITIAAEKPRVMARVRV